MFVSLKALLTRSIPLTVLVLVALTFAAVAFGQTQSAAADLQGTIKDSTGAVVPNATITVRNPGTNISRTGTSNEEGFYRIVNLPGDYEITVSCQFQKAVLTRVNLTVGQTATVDVA
jgi:hypothetical protein